MCSGGLCVRANVVRLCCVKRMPYFFLSAEDSRLCVVLCAVTCYPGSTCCVCTRVCACVYGWVDSVLSRVVVVLPFDF